MNGDLGVVAEADRRALAAWIGERPETVLAVDALLSGWGRAWVAGPWSAPDAVLVESVLVPGEPQGFGDGAMLLDLLERADGWRCIEVTPALADELADPFERRWGLARSLVDVIHTLDRPAPAIRAGAPVQAVTPDDLDRLRVEPTDLFPDERAVRGASAAGRVFGAVRDGVIVAHGCSFAAGERYADVGVHVAAPHRGQGLATAAAALACRAVQRAGLIPVWGAGEDNTASLRVAEHLGFTEVERLVFLVAGTSG